MKKSIIAGASVLALAGAVMPMAGVFAADDTDITDTIKVTVEASCTFKPQGNGTLDGTYTATGVNGAPVSPSLSNSNVHTFNVFCNNNKGFTVSATAHDLTNIDNASPAIADTFAYKKALSATAGAAGEWHANFAGVSTGVTPAQLEDSTGGTSTGTIITKNASTTTAGDEWTATYTALIGTDTKAGNYQGTIDYTLAPAM